jgi:pantoate--beta-alanine ligase
MVVSICVNPTQFGPNEDLTRYCRRPFEADVEAVPPWPPDVDVIFHPEPATIYPNDFRTFVEVTGFAGRVSLRGPVGRATSAAWRRWS